MLKLNFRSIDILDDYYNGLEFQPMIDAWVAENVALTKTIPQETLGKINGIVKQGYLQGVTTKNIGKQIQESYKHFAKTVYPLIGNFSNPQPLCLTGLLSCNSPTIALSNTASL